MEEDNGYDKFILYPPPLNFFLIPLFLVSFSKVLTKKVSKCITILFFWFENFFLIMAFFLYLIAFDPIVIIKTYYQILTKIDGFCNKLLYTVLWTLFCLIYLLYVNILDTGMLINILCL
jgi:hypothetical protein